MDFASTKPRQWTSSMKGKGFWFQKKKDRFGDRLKSQNSGKVTFAQCSPLTKIRSRWHGLAASPPLGTWRSPRSARPVPPTPLREGQRLGCRHARASQGQRAPWAATRGPLHELGGALHDPKVPLHDPGVPLHDLTFHGRGGQAAGAAGRARGPIVHQLQVRRVERVRPRQVRHGREHLPRKRKRRKR